VAFAVEAEPLPLEADAKGVLRVGGTRIPLDTVVEAFTTGSTPEEIVRRFDALRLEDVYLVLGYYLRHRPEVEAYLAQRRDAGEAHRAQAEANLSWAEVRARLQARTKASDAATGGG
jgi:uncharacterized protein (DUF433 family)